MDGPLTAHLLVKLGEPQLAWLAADRAINTATDPHHTAYATVALTQALRTLNRGRLALAAATTAVRGIHPTLDHDPPPDRLALAGTLLTEAAIATATHGDTATAADRTAPAEVRLRPTAHTIVSALLRAGPTAADVTRLATAIGLTRPS